MLSNVKRIQLWCICCEADETAKRSEVLLHGNDVSSLFLLSEFHFSLIRLDHTEPRLKLNDS